MNAAGSVLIYLTYLGTTSYVTSPFPPSPANRVSALAVDRAGNAYLVGRTTDPKFPATRGVYQAVYSGPAAPPPFTTPPSDAFVARLNPEATALGWATYLGGTAADSATAVTLDPGGNVWVTGATESREFPNLNGWSSGGEFVVGFDPEGAGLLYSARYPSGLAGADIAADSTGAVRVTGGGGLVSVLEPRQPPPMLIGAIGNAAGGPVSGRIAPGELVSIYGPGIGPATPATAVLDGTGRVAKSLAGVQVLFDGIAAPLLYVSSTQINAIVPFALRDKKSADIRVSLGSVTSPTFAAAVLPTAPEIFRSTGDFAAALNENGSINSSSQPARWGSVVTIWATGTGAIPAADGEVAASAENYYCCEVEVGSRRLEVLYAGASPGLAAGVTQINFRLLEQQFGRTIGVRIRAGGRTSRGVILYVD